MKFDVELLFYLVFRPFQMVDSTVLLLWGGVARKKQKLINTSDHLVLESGHPSPLSANRGYWFGNKHFSKCNSYLIKNNLTPIKWV